MKDLDLALKLPVDGSLRNSIEKQKRELQQDRGEDGEETEADAAQESETSDTENASFYDAFEDDAGEAEEANADITSCSVCQNRFSAAVMTSLSCGHVLCGLCTEKWQEICKWRRSEQHCLACYKPVTVASRDAEQIGNGISSSNGICSGSSGSASSSMPGIRSGSSGSASSSTPVIDSRRAGLRRAGQQEVERQEAQWQRLQAKNQQRYEGQRRKETAAQGKTEVSPEGGTPEQKEGRKAKGSVYAEPSTPVKAGAAIEDDTPAADQLTPEKKSAGKKRRVLIAAFR